MSKQTIADFEAEIQEVCEKYREKLAHAELVGVLDNVKVSYQVATLQNFNEPSGQSPSPKETDNAKKKES